MCRWLSIVMLAASCGVSAASTPPLPAHAPDAQVRGIVQRVSAQLASADSAHEPAAPHAHATVVRTKPAAQSAAAHASAANVSHGLSASDPESIWDALLAGNRRFVDSKPLMRPLAAQRMELAKGQHPHAIVLTCADSRVGPELVFDQSLGDLFVVRTAGNVADAVALGSLEYAVEHLHTHLLIVLGHEKCGAVRAALEPGDMPTVNLQAIVDRIRPATEKPRTCFEGEELVSRCVATNVHQSARDLATHSPILRDHLSRQNLVIKRAVYDLKSGVVTTLE